MIELSQEPLANTAHVICYCRLMDHTLFIHHGYDNVESGPAEEVERDSKRLLLKLLFIPFSYATPTYGDVVAASRDEEFEGNYAFECPRKFGMDVEELHQHGGRYTLIVDFELGDAEWALWFPEEDEIMTSMAWPDEEGKPGRLYIASESTRSPSDIMDALQRGHPEATFTLIHPIDED